MKIASQSVAQRVLLRFAFGLPFLAVVLIGTAARAQTPEAPCELHVWSTARFNAVYHGASSGGWGPGSLTLTLSPMDAVARRVGLAADTASQLRKIEEMKLGETAAFRGYMVVFHEAPAASPYANWLQKNVAKGPRYGGSKAACYAELHVVFITLFRTAISKKIQTGFVFREFGPTGDATFDFIDAGSTGAPAFDTESEADDPAARASVQDAFATNLRIFLDKRKMRARRGNK